jgi:hypothetical protein
MRALLPLALALTLAGCPTYDRYSKLDKQDGLMSADAFARFGAEEAQKIAIGRKLAEVQKGRSPEEFGKSAEEATAYARTLPDVVDVKADDQGYWMTVTFKSGWRVAVLPVADGTKAEETPGLAKR